MFKSKLFLLFILLSLLSWGGYDYSGSYYVPYYIKSGKGFVGTGSGFVYLRRYLDRASVSNFDNRLNSFLKAIENKGDVGKYYSPDINDNVVKSISEYWKDSDYSNDFKVVRSLYFEDKVIYYLVLDNQPVLIRFEKYKDGYVVNHIPRSDILYYAISESLSRRDFKGDVFRNLSFYDYVLYRFGGLLDSLSLIKIDGVYFDASAKKYSAASHIDKQFLEEVYLAQKDGVIDKDEATLFASNTFVGGALGPVVAALRSRNIGLYEDSCVLFDNSTIRVFLMDDFLGLNFLAFFDDKLVLSNPKKSNVDDSFFRDLKQESSFRNICFEG